MPHRLCHRETRRLPRPLALAVPVLAVLAGVLPAPARDVTAEERMRLQVAVQEFEANLNAGNYRASFELTPPPLMQHMADLMGRPVAEAKDVAATLMAEIMQAAAPVEFEMEVAAARYLETGNGAPYALIPTTTVGNFSDQDGSRVEIRAQTLAFMDDGRWYLVRISETQNVVLLQKYYPRFAGVELPGNTVRVLD